MDPDNVCYGVGMLQEREVPSLLFDFFRVENYFRGEGQTPRYLSLNFGHKLNSGVRAIDLEIVSTVEEPQITGSGKKSRYMREALLHVGKFVTARFFV